MKDEVKKRLEDRLKEIKECNTVEELAFSIWPASMDAAIGSRKPYRDGFIDWIESTKSGIKKPNWEYGSINELVDAIWNPKYDRNYDDRSWFGGLRIEVSQWIYRYVSK